MCGCGSGRWGTHLTQREDVVHSEMVDDEEENVSGEGGEGESVHGGDAEGRGMAGEGGWLYMSEGAKAAAIGCWAAGRREGRRRA